MCRMTALAATIVALSAGSAMAAEKPAAPPARAPAVAAAPAPLKASPAERAQAQRLDPLARAAFWAREADVDPTDVPAAIALSQALRTLGRYDDAAVASGRVIVLAPDNLEGLLENARAYVGAGKGFYAIEPAKRAQALAPRDWRPVALLGVAYEQTRRDDEALAAYRQALTMAPNEPGALSNLAMYYAGHGDLTQAETLLRKAVALPGATAQVRQNLVLVLGLEQRFDEAERLARQDLPPEAVANNMAWLRAAAGQGPAPSTRNWDALKGGQ